MYLIFSAAVLKLRKMKQLRESTLLFLQRIRMGAFAVCEQPASVLRTSAMRKGTCECAFRMHKKWANLCARKKTQMSNPISKIYFVNTL